MHMLICKFVTNHTICSWTYTWKRAVQLMAEQTPQQPIFLCPRHGEKGGLVTGDRWDSLSLNKGKVPSLHRKGELMGREACPQEGFLVSGYGVPSSSPSPLEAQGLGSSRTFLLGVPARRDLEGPRWTRRP